MASTCSTFENNKGVGREVREKELMLEIDKHCQRWCTTHEELGKQDPCSRGERHLNQRPNLENYQEWSNGL